MQFKSNTESAGIVGYTRLLAGDPSAAPSPMWSAAEVENVINAEYLNLSEIAYAKNSGLGTTVSYATLTASTAVYANPSGFHSWVGVEIEPEGKNISTDSEATPRFLEPRNENVIAESLDRGEFSGVQFYAIRDTNIVLIDTPTSNEAGTNAMRLTYRKMPTSLASTTDTPWFSAAYHDLLCYRAAIALKASRDMPFQDLASLMIPKQASFERWAGDLHDDDFDYSIPTAGKIHRESPFMTGRIKRF